MPLGTIPWAEIKVLYEGTDGPRMTSLEIEKKFGADTVTRQGIEKRASKEAWKGCKPLGPKDRALDAIQGVTLLDTKNLATEDRLAQILVDIEKGATDKLASLKNGIDPATLTRWKESDPKFAAAVDAARAQRAMKRLGRVEAAGERGDWKADTWLLGRDSLTKEEFGEHTERPSLAIQINITRGEDETVTVDGLLE